MKLRRSVPLFLLVAALLFLTSSPMQAQCNVGLTPNPLTLFSMDYFDIYGNLIAISAGRGIVTATSPFPNCVQLESAWYFQQPLTMIATAPPLQVPGMSLWQSQYLIGDSGALVVSYYPYFAGGTLAIAGVDITSGAPFAGNSAIALTIFRTII
jgi:hypothetical protein